MFVPSNHPDPSPLPMVVLCLKNVYSTVVAQTSRPCPPHSERAALHQIAGTNEFAAVYPHWRQHALATVRLSNVWCKETFLRTIGTTAYVSSGVAWAVTWCLVRVTVAVTRHEGSGREDREEEGPKEEGLDGIQMIIA